jgi:sporulation protein YlmC with PRC-barrel domain
MLVDQQGRHLGKLQDVYVDVETDEPMFATVKEGLWPGRHLTFVPLVDVHVEPKEIRVSTTADRVASAPDLQEHGEELSQGDEAALYHHFGQNYFPVTTVSGRRLARR